MQTIAIPGPTLKPDQPLPCGCRLAREADGRFRFWYCRTHGAAFEMLEALRLSADALEATIRRSPGDLESARRAHAAAQHAIQKAKV